MIILLGNPCSGKTDIAEQLYILGYSRLTPYTTRPPLPEERDGVSYHFVTKEFFEAKLKENFFAETTSYQEENGETYYFGTAVEDVTDDKVAVANVDSLRAFKKLPWIHPISFFLYAGDESVLGLLRRKKSDRPPEPLIEDVKEFENVRWIVDYFIRSDNGDSPEEIANIIDKIVQEKEMAKAEGKDKKKESKEKEKKERQKQEQKNSQKKWQKKEKPKQKKDQKKRRHPTQPSKAKRRR